MKIILRVIFAFAIITASVLPLFSDKADAKTSYMRAKNKIYYGIDYFAWDDRIKTKEEYVKTNKKGQRVFQYTSTIYGKIDRDNSYLYYEKETKTGLYDGKEKYLPYPIKLNKTWRLEGEKQKIVDVDATIKVKAGTFKHVVVTKSYPEGNTKNNYYYTKTWYAPNVGEILQKFYECASWYDVNNKYYPGTLDVDKEFELTKIKNK